MEMIFSDPAFNAIYVFSFIISIFSLPKCFAMGIGGEFLSNKVKWKHLIITILISTTPLANTLGSVIGFLFWTIWIIKEIPFMDVIKQILNEDVF